MFATLCTGRARDAHAHGGIPRAQDILFEPGNPSHIVVRSDYWGLFETRDAGRTWVLICSEAFGGRALQSERFPTAVAAGGRIFVAAGFEGLHVSDDGCNFRVVPDSFSATEGVVSMSVSPIDASGSNFLRVDALPLDGGVASRILRSADRGDTWSEASSTLPGDFAPKSVFVAPSDPRRLYAAGHAFSDMRYELEVSEDGGDTWQLRPLPVGGSDVVLIATVHPTEPDSLIVRIDGIDALGAGSGADELWSTTDAGQHWTRIFRANGDLPGFALSSANANLFVAGPNDGVQWAPLASIFAPEFSGFQGWLGGKAFGLAYSQGNLFVGTDQFAQAGEPRATIQVTPDRKLTFTPVMDLCDVTFPKCGANSTVERVCREQWDRGFVTDYLQMGPCARDGGVTPTGAAGTGGTTSGGGGSEARGGEGGAAPGGTAVSAENDASVGAGGSAGNRRLHIVTVACSATASRSPAFPASVLVVSMTLGAALRRRGSGLRGSARRSA